MTTMTKRPRHAVVAYLLGVRDGWRSPFVLSTSVDIDNLKGAPLEAFDQGINLGQFLRAGRASETAREGYPILPRRILLRRIFRRVLLRR